MTDDQLVDEVLDGTLRLWRFTAEEQSGSSDTADRFLWHAILHAERELAASLFGSLCSGTSQSDGGAPSPYRFLKNLSQPLPNSFEALTNVLGFYEDRGQESLVCDAGDGFVNKIRPMKPSALTGYLAPLANIVYHNRIFPRERYTLENIYVAEDRYYMVLRQRRVEILLDENGYPVKPTRDQILSAVRALPVSLLTLESSGREGSSSDSSGSQSGASLKLYNSDYYISDLQPGRNTVIDAQTGDVRFIDPRITLNDPTEPITPVSHLGTRREDLPGQLFE